jgi:amidase
MKKLSIEESGAFVETFLLEPTGSGILNGLTFAVKDLIDIAGRTTGCGNPTWLKTHPPASVHAVCVEQLLAAGARCIGKTITDEMAFSLIGQNHFYGTPLNPKAPDRVPGGSSSGSASAVACGVVDFALGTDTGGSVRIPASNCGIFGFRPSHGIVSVAGVHPLSPSFDTVGVFSSSIETLVSSASVLLASPIPEFVQPQNIFLIREAFSISDDAVQKAMNGPLRQLQESFGNQIRDISIRDMDQDSSFSDFEAWNDIYRVLQRAEAESCHGAWVAEHHPDFGDLIAEAFQLIRKLDRKLIPDCRNSL